MRPAHHRRGQAVAELALVLPILVTIFLFGMFFTELLRAKLKLLEASRFAGFEMTSHVLDDYGSDAANRHDRAFGLAMNDTVSRTNAMFRDLDSVAPNGPTGGLVAGYSAVAATIQNKPVTIDGHVAIELPRDLPEPPRRLSGSSTEAFRLFDFDQKGRVQVEVSMRLDDRILPRHFLDDSGGFFKVDQWGGSNLQSIALKSRFSVIASGWQLPDGSDAEMRVADDGVGSVAGAHRQGNTMHGLWKQVNRMTHLRARPQDTDLGLKALDPVSFVMPKPYNSTYVVSHNYGLSSEGNRGCDSVPGNADPLHASQGGMNNLMQSSVIDYPYRKCFDTAPFRDQASYDDSMPAAQLEQRGPYFMGCQQAQADDTGRGDLSRLGDDYNRRKTSCVP